jgi:hypothetical protein
MNPIVSNLTKFQNIPAGYNPLSSSITRDPLNITNFSNASSGYNVVVPAVDIANLSIYNIPGIDNKNSSLKVGVFTPTIVIGGVNTSTYIYSKVTVIESQTIQIGLTTTTSLGNLSSPFANISVLNTSTANVSKLNASNAYISTLNVALTNASTLNASVANISTIHSNIGYVNNMTCYNLSAFNIRQSYASWYTTSQVEPRRIIGDVSLDTVETSVINNVSSLSSYYGVFTCDYDGIYACSVIVTPITTTGIILVYVRKNNNYIGPIIYGNTGNQIASFSGSLTLHCKAGDTLCFYNLGVALLARTSTINITDSNTIITPTSAQLCSITLL